MFRSPKKTRFPFKLHLIVSAVFAVVLFALFSIVGTGDAPLSAQKTILATVNGVLFYWAGAFFAYIVL